MPPGVTPNVAELRAQAAEQLFRERHVPARSIATTRSLSPEIDRAAYQVAAMDTYRLAKDSAHPDFERYVAGGPRAVPLAQGHHRGGAGRRGSCPRRGACSGARRRAARPGAGTERAPAVVDEARLEQQRAAFVADAERVVYLPAADNNMHRLGNLTDSLPPHLAHEVRTNIGAGMMPSEAWAQVAREHPQAVAQAVAAQKIKLPEATITVSTLEKRFSDPGTLEPARRALREFHPQQGVDHGRAFENFQYQMPREAERLRSDIREGLGMTRNDQVRTPEGRSVTYEQFRAATPDGGVRLDRLRTGLTNSARAAGLQPDSSQQVVELYKVRYPEDAAKAFATVREQPREMQSPSRTPTQSQAHAPGQTVTTERGQQLDFQQLKASFPSPQSFQGIEAQLKQTLGHEPTAQQAWNAVEKAFPNQAAAAVKTVTDKMAHTQQHESPSLSRSR